MTILLDTSVIIDALNYKRGRHDLIKSYEESGDTLACSAINVAEVYAGMKPHEAQATDAFFQRLECIEINENIARMGGLLKYEWARKGVTLDIPDAIIAAVALSFDLTLATDNTKDFPMPELKFLPLPTA